MLKINDIKVENNGEYAHDNCHKFYILKNENEKFKAIELGYEISPLTKLVTDLKLSCPLRFISSFDLEHTYLLQGAARVDIELDGKLNEIWFRETL